MIGRVWEEVLASVWASFLALNDQKKVSKYDYKVFVVNLWGDQMDLLSSSS
jgi:hypothetical protein